MLIEIQDLHFAYFNIVASFILYAGPYAEQNINYAVYKACYDILFIYAGPHALYILLSVHTHDTLVIEHDYILFCYAGPYAFYFRFMSSVLTDMYLILCGTIHMAV